MSASILMLGCFDTKGEEYAFLREQIHRLGYEVLAVNFGVFGSTELFPVDIEADQLAKAAGADLVAMRTERDRGNAMKAMAQGAAIVTKQVFQEGKVGGIIGMGGSGGSSVITAAMRALPIGVPKVCVSTVAGADTSTYIGTKDITLIPSITDVAGINRISRVILTRAAGAICGMSSVEMIPSNEDKPIIVASMFGNTTECVDACRSQLIELGFEVLVFHATGTGGKTMESLIDEGLVDACLDITTTECADTLCGGVFDAGEDRLTAPGRQGIPHLIVPGCIDMVNFGPLRTVPQHYRDGHRQFYEWNQAVTLMRTNKAENKQLGEAFACKANRARGPVAFLLPKRGVSILSGEGQPFHDPTADQAMFDAIKENVAEGIAVEELDLNINNPLFAQAAVQAMRKLMDEAAQTKETARGDSR